MLGKASWGPREMSGRAGAGMGGVRTGSSQLGMRAGSRQVGGQVLAQADVDSHSGLLLNPQSTVDAEETGFRRKGVAKES